MTVEYVGRREDNDPRIISLVSNTIGFTVIALYENKNHKSEITSGEINLVGQAGTEVI